MEILIIVLFYVIVIVAASVIRARLVKNEVKKIIEEKEKEGVSDDIRSKSEKMVKKGPTCPPHNWYWKPIVNEWGEKVEIIFCDLCKKSPGDL